MCLSLGLPARAQTQDFQLLDKIIAVVNDGVVLQSDLEQETGDVIRQLRSQNRNLPDAETMRRQVLGQLILKTVQLQRAKSIGLQIDDTALNRALEEIAGNNRMNLGQFREALLQEGYDYRQFREKIRDELLIAQLRRREVANNISVSEQEIEDELTRMDRGLEREIERQLRQIFVAIPEGSNAARIQQAESRARDLVERIRNGADFVSLAARESDGERALEGGDLGWRTPAQLPSLFAEAVIALQIGGITEPIRSPIGYHILQLVDTRGEERHMVRETLARHILLRVTPVRSSAQARAELVDLRQRIQAGESFGDLARTHSDDGASASQGGELPWFSKGMMDPGFEQITNDLPAGELSEPFQSSFGWHIVEVLDRRDADNTEEFQRSRARRSIRERKLEVETDTWLRRLRDEAYVDFRTDEPA